MADVLEKTPSPVPKAFLVFAVEAYQISYLVKKALVCPGIKYDDLKRIVLDSGTYLFLKYKNKMKELLSTQISFNLNGRMRRIHRQTQTINITECTVQ